MIQAISLFLLQLPRTALSPPVTILPIDLAVGTARRLPVGIPRQTADLSWYPHPRRIILCKQSNNHGRTELIIFLA